MKSYFFNIGFYFIGLFFLQACNKKTELLNVANELKSQLSDNEIIAKSSGLYNCQDIALGAGLFSSDLSCYNFYGEFIENGYVNYYISYPDNYSILGIKINQVILCFANGFLSKKIYLLEKDILLNYDLPIPSHLRSATSQRTGQLKLRLGSRSFIYRRSFSSFVLYEVL